MHTLLKSSILALNLLVAGMAFGVDEGDVAPDFLLPVVGSESSISLSDSHGKVRYVDFWASWCAPCRVSIPQIASLHEELGGERFEVIGINVDERSDDAIDFLDRFPVSYDNLGDPNGVTAEAYGLRTMPTSYVIDAEGRVTLVHEGFRRGDMDAIRAHVIELLGQQQADSP